MSGAQTRSVIVRSLIVRGRIGSSCSAGARSKAEATLMRRLQARGSNCEASPDRWCAAAFRDRPIEHSDWARGGALRRSNLDRRGCRSGSRGWGGGLTGGDDFALSNEPRLALGEPPRAADALDAVSALLHYAAGPDTDVGIVRGLDDRIAEIAIFLAVDVAEPVEAPHLVGAVRLAEARADAAVIDLDVEPRVIVHRRFDRTDGLAGAASHCMQGTG